MKISIRGKIFLAFAIFIGLSALIWARSYYSQYILNQKIQIIERKYDLFNAILEARRYEKNYFLSFDKENIVQALDYARQAEEILRDILSKYGKYTLAKNLDQRITELVTYKESLSNLLKLQEEDFWSQYFYNILLSNLNISRWNCENPSIRSLVMHEKHIFKRPFDFFRPNRK